MLSLCIHAGHGEGIVHDCARGDTSWATYQSAPLHCRAYHAAPASRHTFILPPSAPQKASSRLSPGALDFVFDCVLFHVRVTNLISLHLISRSLACSLFSQVPNNYSCNLARSASHLSPTAAFVLSHLLRSSAAVASLAELLDQLLSQGSVEGILSSLSMNASKSQCKPYILYAQRTTCDDDTYCMCLYVCIICMYIVNMFTGTNMYIFMGMSIQMGVNISSWCGAHSKSSLCWLTMRTSHLLQLPLLLQMLPVMVQSLQIPLHFMLRLTSADVKPISHLFKTASSPSSPRHPLPLLHDAAIILSMTMMKKIPLQTITVHCLRLCCTSWPTACWSSAARLVRVRKWRTTLIWIPNQQINKSHYIFDIDIYTTWSHLLQLTLTGNESAQPRMHACVPRRNRSPSFPLSFLFPHFSFHVFEKKMLFLIDFSLSIYYTVSFFDICGVCRNI